MRPVDLLAALAKARYRVTVEGDSLRVRGPLTDDLRQAIREHKAALLELLRPTPPPWQGHTVRFVGPSPVILGPHGDPIDFRRDPLTGKWRHEPGWWKGIPRKGEANELRLYRG